MVHWPDVAERAEIAKRMKDNHDFPSCVMVGDGTLSPLEYAPQSSDSGDYSGRKYKYSITCFIMNDDQKRIRSYLAGWPGSVHDNRVFKKTDVFQHPETYYSPGQYMLTDSAVDNSDYLIAAFKKPRLQVMPVMNKQFNTKLARVRISSEHTIGILKGRFPWLKGISNLLTDDKKHMIRILKLIDCCVILHNILLDFEKKPHPEQDTWLEEIDADDIENDFAGENLTCSIGSGNRKDERRRQLQTYLEFKEYIA